MVCVKKLLYSTFTLLFVLVVFFIIDQIVGYFYESLAPEFGRKNLELALKTYNGEVSDSRSRAHPYLAYENTPLYEHNGIQQHNKAGYRNSLDFQIEKPDNVFRILVLGGSTTYGHGVDRPADAWPEQLQALLNQGPFKEENFKVQVINGGMLWATTAELLNHYLYRDRDLQADIVILHTGGNDGWPLYYDNFNSEYTHWRWLESGGKNALRIGESHLIRRSNIIRLFYAYWYSKVGYAVPRVWVKTQGAGERTADNALKNVRVNPLTAFNRNLSLLIRNILSDGAAPIYFSFYWPGKSLFAAEASTALEQANRRVNYTEMNEVYEFTLNKLWQAAKVHCDNNNIECWKIPQGTIPAKHFVDQVHLDTNGQLFKAQFILEKLHPQIEKLLENRSKET